MTEFVSELLLLEASSSNTLVTAFRVIENDHVNGNLYCSAGLAAQVAKVFKAYQYGTVPIPILTCVCNVASVSDTFEQQAAHHETKVVETLFRMLETFSQQSPASIDVSYMETVCHVLFNLTLTAPDAQTLHQMQQAIPSICKLVSNLLQTAAADARFDTTITETLLHLCCLVIRVAARACCEAVDVWCDVLEHTVGHQAINQQSSQSLLELLCRLCNFCQQQAQPLQKQQAQQQQQHQTQQGRTNRIINLMASVLECTTAAWTSTHNLSSSVQQSQIQLRHPTDQAVYTVTHIASAALRALTAAADSMHQDFSSSSSSISSNDNTNNVIDTNRVADVLDRVSNAARTSPDVMNRLKQEDVAIFFTRITCALHAFNNLCACSEFRNYNRIAALRHQLFTAQQELEQQCKRAQNAEQKSSRLEHAMQCIRTLLSNFCAAQHDSNCDT
jgi:hypothetical protein